MYTLRQSTITYDADYNYNFNNVNNNNDIESTTTTTANEDGSFSSSSFSGGGGKPCPTDVDVQTDTDADVDAIVTPAAAAAAAVVIEDQQQQLNNNDGSSSSSSSSIESSTATVMAMATGYSLLDYQHFVGSLRKTGFNGNIILAVAPNIENDIELYLLSKEVIIKKVQYVKCSHITKKELINKTLDEIDSSHDRELVTCLYPYSNLKHRWGKFQLRLFSQLLKVVHVIVFCTTTADSTHFIKEKQKWDKHDNQTKEKKELIYLST
jgi:hypothetical protein